MKRVFWTTLLAWLALRGFGLAHEPIFGLGPHTVGKYGWAIENELEREADQWTDRLELLYGLTADAALTISLPYYLSSPHGSAGPGDVVLRGKYRFFRRDFRGGSRAFAFHLGIKLASGNRNEGRGTGSVDGFAGLSFGLETRRHYSFAAVRYRLNGPTGTLNRGEQFNLEAAYGMRPWLLAYHQPDLVVLLEVLAEHHFPDRVRGSALPGSEETVLSVAPGFLFSIRNVMIKGGLKLPLTSRELGSRPGSERTLVLAVDIHMPPLK